MYCEIINNVLKGFHKSVVHENNKMENNVKLNLMLEKEDIVRLLGAIAVKSKTVLGTYLLTCIIRTLSAVAAVNSEMTVIPPNTPYS